MAMLCLMMLTAVWANAATTAKWDFQNDIPAGIQENTNYQGVAADVESDVPGIVMHVDATGGKLYCVGRNNAQMNPGTVLQVPVTTTDDVVTVEGYPGYCHFAVGGEENGDETTVAHKATNAEVKQGYVEVTATAGNNYIYSVTVVQNKPDVNAFWDFKNDLPAGICEATNYQGTEADVESTVKGVFMHVDATNGKLYCVGRNNAQMNPGTVIRVPVVSSEDVVTVEGYPGYCHFAVGNEANGGETTVAHKATNAEAKQGYVEVTATEGNNYIYTISVKQKTALAPVRLDNVEATATFPFDQGVDGQVADFGTATDYFLGSKVTIGSGLFIKDVNSGGGMPQTRIEPYDQNDKADETNLIQFTILPKPGLAFTPTEVSLKTTRFGTDNGLLDIAWLNADGTTVSLATELKPNRNNGQKPANESEEGQTFSDLKYEIKDAAPSENTCALLINLYHLQSGKQIGFADIVVKGLLNGEEMDVPMLGTLTANGVEYNADDIFEPQGDAYAATIELSKKEEMISETNPVTNVTALSGEVGEITYAPSNDAGLPSCKVTIPVTLAGITINYYAFFVYKPDFTLSYIDTDGTVMGTQLVEKDAPIGQFDIDYATAKAEEGYKVRGWFVKRNGGKKYTTADIITSDINLYAFATEIEGPSTYKKYNFDLTDVNFDPADHEGFATTGSGYWHDTQHGWAFANGDQITLLVGEKASIFVTNCLYSKAEAEIIFKDAEGNELGRIPCVGESDGQIAAFAYQGAAGPVTLEISAGGAVYIHSIRIVNTAEVIYDNQGDWLIVKAGDAESFLSALDAANERNAAADAQRTYIFLPDGTYDLGETALTAIVGNNVSIIGQSTEGTIIKNAPPFENEGIGTTATLVNSGKNLYMQDLTLQNALDYYGTQRAGQSAGRAVCFQDRSDRAIFKNVAMLSYQDTYYSQGTKQSYWEDCDIHGTVDFLCGGGDVLFQNTTLSLEPRNIDGKGGRTICAPTTSTEFGYVFNNCKVVDLAQGKGDWNFGRTWQNDPIAVYINTTLDDNAKATLVASRWTEKGMNNRDPKCFGEYGTKNEAGEDITPASNIINSYKVALETILTAEQADAFSYDKMFKNNANAWDPASMTVQAAAPTAAYADGKLTWSNVNEAIAYAVFKNGVFQSLNEGSSLAIEAAEGDILTIRSANAMGGFGEAFEVTVKAAEEPAILDADIQTLPAGDYATIKTDRKLLSGLNTIVLPFDATPEEIGAATALEYIGTVMRNGTLILQFKPVEALSANTPYAVFVENDYAIGSFENKTVAEPTDLTVTDSEYNFVGTYTAYDKGASPIAANDLIAGEKEFIIANGGNRILTYRAYLKKVGTSEANIAFDFNGDIVDGIDAARLLDRLSGNTYNLNGQKVNRTQKGIYIIDGKKVVVK